MKRKLVMVGLWLVMLSRGLCASESTAHVFPQFVDGRFADGTYYRTTLMLTNMFTAPATCTWTLHEMTASLDTGESGSTFSVTIPSNTTGISGESLYIRSTTGTQAFQSGYATISCSVPVFALVIYGYYASDGTKLGEATITDSVEFSLFVLPVDQRENSRVGIAVANNTDFPPAAPQRTRWLSP
jgi:hypothetical protein